MTRAPSIAFGSLGLLERHLSESFDILKTIVDNLDGILAAPDAAAQAEAAAATLADYQTQLNVTLTELEAVLLQIQQTGVILSGAQIVDMVDTQLSGTVWRDAPPAQLTGVQITSLLDTYLGSTDWRTNTGGGGGSQNAPQATGSLPDVNYAQNTGVQTVNAAGVFAYATNGSWSVSGAGSTINSSGVVSIPTTSLHNGTVITVTYTNNLGSASVAFQVFVENIPLTYEAFIPAGSDGLTAAGEVFNVRV